jgi:acyl-CoA synthetase (NDP forming)
MSFDIRMDNNPVDFLDHHGIMPYSAPDKAASALARAVRYHQWVEENIKDQSNVAAYGRP